MSLVNGRIPAYTECPYVKVCMTKKENRCHHTGINHSVPYSCATARGYKMMENFAQTPQTGLPQGMPQQQFELPLFHDAISKVF